MLESFWDCKITQINLRNYIGLKNIFKKWFIGIIRTWELG